MSSAFVSRGAKCEVRSTIGARTSLVLVTPLLFLVLFGHRHQTVVILLRTCGLSSPCPSVTFTPTSLALLARCPSPLWWQPELILLFAVIFQLSALASGGALTDTPDTPPGPQSVSVCPLSDTWHVYCLALSEHIPIVGSLKFCFHCSR